MSIKERIEQRLKGVGADQWFRVAFQMTGGQEKATMVMMFAIDELHRAGADSVQITHPRWKAWGFNRDRIKNAGNSLRRLGVIYTNHTALTWHIEDAVFWTAFEAAFKLVFPHIDGDAGNQQGVGNQQAAGGDAEGNLGANPAENQHTIEIDSDSKNTNKPNMLEVFERYRLQFTGNLNAQLARMINAAATIGLDAARIVIHRCMAAGGRTWNYVATALENEVLALTQPRQLKLLPVDVPAAPAAPKVQRDGQKNQFAGLNKLVIDGVDMIRVHRGYGKYDYVSVAEYEREQEAAATAALEKERYRQAEAERRHETFDNAPPVHPVAPVEESAPSYTGEGAAEWGIAYRQMQLHDKMRFESFIEGTRLVSASAGRFVVEVKHDFKRQMLQNRLYRWVKRLLSDACGRDVEIEFVVGVAA